MSLQNTAHLPAPLIDAAPAPVERFLRQRPRLDVGVASTLGEVTAAWNLAYDCYRRIGIIDENAQGLFTHPHAVLPETSVVVGKLEGEPVSTLTIMHDHPVHGLPLDRVYNRQLNLLRRLGRPLVEVGLLADRREKVGKAFGAIMEMMRYVYWNACFHGADVLCGVHPRHAEFYIRTFGFDAIGPVMLYSAVRNNPVILLRVTTVNHLLRERLPRGLPIYVRNALSRDAFDGRCPLSPSLVENTVIGDHLRRRALLDEAGLITSPGPACICPRGVEQSLAA